MCKNQWRHCQSHNLEVILVKYWNHPNNSCFHQNQHNNILFILWGSSTRIAVTVQLDGGLLSDGRGGFPSCSDLPRWQRHLQAIESTGFKNSWQFTKRSREVSCSCEPTQMIRWLPATSQFISKRTLSKPYISSGNACFIQMLVY